MRTIELYKLTKNGLVHVDYGVEAQVDSYVAQGYITVVEYKRGEGTQSNDNNQMKIGGMF